MAKAVACAALLALAGCGLDGPPTRPAPAPAAAPAPQTGVVIGGSGYVGVTATR